MIGVMPVARNYPLFSSSRWKTFTIKFAVLLSRARIWGTNVVLPPIVQCRRPAPSCVPSPLALDDPPQLFPGLVFILAGSPARLRQGEKIMKRTVIGIVLMGVLGAGSLMAEDRDWRGRDLRRDYADRRADYRDMARDRAKIAQDKRELREEYREGDWRGVQRERSELRNEYRDLNHDRWDARRDTRDIRHDRFWGWR